MSTCIAARIAIIALRLTERSAKRTNLPSWRAETRLYTLVFPATWSKTNLLNYVRQEHPNQTVRIMEWGHQGKADQPWETALWLANPKGFFNYVRAIPEPIDREGKS